MDGLKAVPFKEFSFSAASDTAGLKSCPDTKGEYFSSLLVLSGPVVENDPADGHGHQQETGEKEQQPGHDPPDAGLRWQNAPLGLETVCLAQYPGQQQEETYRKH
jgi:hypothetical protein